jgi:hypothetical protein
MDPAGGGPSPWRGTSPPRQRRPPGLFAGALALAGLALLGVELAAAEAATAPVSIVWSTYLRTGPGSGFQVIDEIEHDTRVDLIGCKAHWCQVRSDGILGFVDQDSISLPRLSTGKAPAGGHGPCFVTGQYGYKGLAPTKFCQVRPKS